MEVHRMLTSPLKRKPLSDCSNVAITKPSKPSLIQTPSLKSHPLPSSDDGNHIPTVLNVRKDTTAKKYESKIVEETPISELFSSDNCNQSRPLIFTSKSKDVRLRNNEEKALEPVTPHATHLITAPSGCGIDNQRKSPRRRKHADGKALPLVSCPPGKRTKKKGLSNWIKQDDAMLGSLPDPLPLHEKKRSWNQKHEAIIMHGLPQDEIDRLRSYYADVDAFELTEEVAPEMDSD